MNGAVEAGVSSLVIEQNGSLEVGICRLDTTNNDGLLTNVYDIVEHAPEDGRSILQNRYPFVRCVVAQFSKLLFTGPSRYRKPTGQAGLLACEHVYGKARGRG
jgi:hypothetical protein